MSFLRLDSGATRRAIYAFAALASILTVGLLLLPGQERLSALGPANTGHEQLSCTQCHTPADGTIRQQVQANVRFLAGLRTSGADFVHRPVGNGDCIACHQNDEDRHPVYRFNEPRFAEARETIAPQYCVSCHAEHTGRRVTAEPTVCSSCHTDLKIQDDPIQPTHAALVAQKDWGSCMSCHDFHGNHIRTTPRRLEDGASQAEILRYIAGGPPIYGKDLRFPARTERVKP